MRFASLELLRYGGFADRRLELTRGECDLHFIFGPNEAGKSTTLEAVGDFLFGFPHGKAQDYRFDASLLRIGAVLEAGPVRLAAQRRRKKPTLVDAAEQEVAEGPLAAMLRGQTREAFRLGWSLDHARLREGGKLMVAAQGDVGQALFAAGAGMAEVARVLQALEAEADGIWAKRRSAARGFSQAEAQLKEATQALARAQVAPKAWSDAKAALEALGARQAAQETELQQARAALRVVDRTRRVAVAVERRNYLLAQLAGRRAPLFSAAAEAGFDQAMAVVAEAGRRLATAEALAAEARASLAGLAPDAAVLARAEAVEALLERRGAVLKGQEDLPARQAELAVKTAEMQGLLAELGQGGRAVAEVMGALPSRAVVARLRGNAKARGEAASRVQAKRQAQAVALREREQVQARMAAAVAPAALGPLQVALAEARQRGDLDAEMARAQRAAEAARRRAGEALERLAPWAGDVAALRGLAVPAEAELDQAMQAQRTAVAERDASAQALRGLADKLALKRLEREGLAGARGAVSAEDLAAARAARDAAWAGLRPGLLAGVAVAAGQVEVFEGLAAAADGLADARFQRAEASAQLLGLDLELTRLAAEVAQAEARAGAAAVAEQAGLRDWQAGLAALGLPVLAPEGLRAWLGLRLAALQAAEVSAEAEAAALAAAEERAAALRALGAAMPTGAALPAGEPGFGALREAAGLALEAMQRQAVAAEAAATRLREAEVKLEASAAEVAAAEAESAALESAWAGMAAEAGIAPHWDDGLAELYERLRAAGEALALLQGRVAGIEHDAARFGAAVLALAEEVGEPAAGRPPALLALALRQRLAEARRVAARADEVAGQLRQQEAQGRAAQAEQDAALAGLAPLHAQAGTVEAEALAAKVEESRQVQAWLGTLAATEQRIVEDGDGLPLEALVAACATADLAALPDEAGRLEAQVQELSSGLTEVAARRGAAEREFAALDHGADAAGAAADAEMARSELEAQAEAYVLKRSQAVLLRWVVERHRQRNQHPLLTRASAVFRRLTLERYQGLAIDHESEKPRLMGLSADGATAVPLENLSMGTADQLFLALRLAAMEQAVTAGMALPFLADDLFINFDDGRALAGLRVLAELARSTQVLFFTHHQHLVTLAREALGPGGAQFHSL